MRNNNFAIDGKKFERACENSGKKKSEIGPAIGLSHNWFWSAQSRGMITIGQARMLDKLLDIKREDYELHEAAPEQEEAAPEQEEAAPEQMELAGGGSNQQAVDYYKIYQAVYAAVYAATMKARDDYRAKLGLK